MGFFDEYDVDVSSFNDAGFDVPDGTYSFEVTSGEVRELESSDSGEMRVVIRFNLENEEGEVLSWAWWIPVPVDPNRPTRRESISLSEWKKWCIGAGFDEANINSVGPDDIEGITGTMRLVSTKGKGKNSDKTYQNARDWTFDGAEPEEAPAKPAAPARAAKPAAAKPVAAKPAAKAPGKGNPFKTK